MTLLFKYHDVLDKRIVSILLSRTIVQLAITKNLDKNMLISIFYYLFKDSIDDIIIKIKKYTFLNELKTIKQYD